MARHKDILDAIERVRTLARLVRPLRNALLDSLIDKAERELLDTLRKAGGREPDNGALGPG